MANLPRTLFIARSQETAELYGQEHPGALETTTLSSLLRSLGESESPRLDAGLGRYLLKSVIASMSFEHFAHLSESERSLDALFSFLLQMKENRVGVEAFGYPELKTRELLRILEAYEAKKRQLGFVDDADVRYMGLAALERDGALSGYGKVVLDRFEEEGVRFYASAVEREALEHIRNLPGVETLPSDLPDAGNAPASFTPNAHRLEEAVFALKAARRLIDAGTAPEAVAIVCSRLEHYRSWLRRFAPQYGLNVRFSSGIPLTQSPLFGLYMASGNFHTFAKRVGEKVAATQPDETTLATMKRHFGIFKNYDVSLRRLVARADELFGFSLQMDTLKRAEASSHFIPPDPEEAGIFVTEPNQMTRRRFEQVIFIGADLATFPPKMGGDIFRTARQKEELLGHDNSYRLSRYFYRRMLANNARLHISYAKNEGCRPLFPSPVVAGVNASSFDVSQIEGERDRLLKRQRARLDAPAETYIDAMMRPEPTPFDGQMRAPGFAFEPLSATHLNTYARCPLRFLFAHRYRLDAIAPAEDEERFEASDIGTIFHSVAERFANDVKAGRIVLDAEPTLQAKRHLEAIADEVFEAYMKQEVDDKQKARTLFHELVLIDLKKGLYEEHHTPGLLIRLLDYFHEEGSLEHFERSEADFWLDRNFRPVEKREAAFLKGFIDRIDVDAETVRVIDYKTGAYKSDRHKRLLEEMAAFREFQLPVYLLYAQQAFDTEGKEAHLVSFRHDDGYRSYGSIGTVEGVEMTFDADYQTQLKARIEQIAEAIGEGAFGMTPSERGCEYCDFERICHHSVWPHKGGEA